MHPDCTERCKSTQHGDIITAAISKRSVSDSDLCAFLTYVCTCCESVRDSAGRTALHVAASCGRIGLVKWLIQNRHANVHVRDVESGYTPLHRSVFYGKINVAVGLLQLGANPTHLDANFLTPLEHAMKDGIVPNAHNCFGEVYAWGQNSNNSLGIHRSKNVPELLDMFHKEFPTENVANICIDEFHTILVTESGKAYACGHGLGGRLGVGLEKTVIISKQVTFPENNGESPFCVQASASRDHSLFLMRDNTVFSCGLNVNKVLGISPPPEKLLSPRSVKHFSTEIVGVCTGRYHSVAWGPNALYSWGLNAGQLGHQKVGDSKYVITPKSVKLINLNNTRIRSVSSSDGATVVCTEKGDIYVLHEYQCRKIASRQLNVTQVRIIGGNLLDKELSNEVSRELKVVALTNTGNLFLWQESDQQLCRCIFSLNRAINIRQVAINLNEILFVTSDGEAFQGFIKPRKKKPSNDKTTEKSAFHKFLEKEDCITLKITKFGRIHRALSIVSDPKGKDYGVIQAFPYKITQSTPSGESQMPNQLEQLLQEANEVDTIHDVLLKVGRKTYPLHKLILAQRSPYLHKLILDNADDIAIDGVDPDVFETLLEYLYTNRVRLPDEVIEEVDSEAANGTSAFEVYNNQKKSTKVKGKTPRRLLGEVAKKFGCVELQKAVQENRRHVSSALTFDRTAYSEFADVLIRCSDGAVIKAHKCILCARMDYFNSMFSVRWHKSTTIDEVNLPFHETLVLALLEYLYTDALGSNTTDIEYLQRLIVLADQFFVNGLKEICEPLLTKELTVKNVTQILVCAHVYNAADLKNNCLKFIANNMPVFLEIGYLNELDDQLLTDLTDCYFRERSAICCRVITPYSTAAPDESIQSISAKYPDILNTGVDNARTPSQKKRLRFQKTPTIESPQIKASSESDNPDTIIQFPDVVDDIKIDRDSDVCRRLQAINFAKNHIDDDDIKPHYVKLNSSRSSADTTFESSLGDFPELNSPPSGGTYSRSPQKHERHKIVRLSQKERKRLSSESKDVTLQLESPKNPWKIIPASPLKETESDVKINDIISHEKKQKENLVKLKSKFLIYTQIEDKAIDELYRFYNADNVEEEIITVQRVDIGAVAVPVWIPKAQGH